MMAGCVVQTGKCGPSERNNNFKDGGKKGNNKGLVMCVCRAWATAPTPHDDRETAQFQSESFKKNLAISHTTTVTICLFNHYKISPPLDCTNC